MPRLRLRRKTYYYVDGADDRVLHESFRCPIDSSGAFRDLVKRVARKAAQRMVRDRRYRLCRRCKGLR